MQSDRQLARRGFDGDALFTFVLSLLLGVLTLGSTHLLLLYRIVRIARQCGYQFTRVEAIAVPGHQLQAGQISADYRRRLDRAASLYRNSPQAVIRIIGGRAQLGLSEAQAGATYLIEQGVPASTISTEEASSNTLENMKLSRDWFTRFDQVFLITNRYHLARLQTLASALQLPTRICAAESQICLPGKKMLTEMLFLHWYWSGRVYASLTRNRRMLDKIT